MSSGRGLRKTRAGAEFFRYFTRPDRAAWRPAYPPARRHIGARAALQRRRVVAPPRARRGPVGPARAANRVGHWFRISGAVRICMHITFRLTAPEVLTPRWGLRNGGRGTPVFKHGAKIALPHPGPTTIHRPGHHASAFAENADRPLRRRMASLCSAVPHGASAPRSMPVQ